MKKYYFLIIFILASTISAQTVKIDKNTAKTLKRLQMIFSNEKYCTVAMVDSIFGPYNEFELTSRTLQYGRKFTREQDNIIQDKIGDLSAKQKEASVFLKWFRKANKGKLEPDSLIIISVKNNPKSEWRNTIFIKAQNKRGDIIRIAIDKTYKSIDDITINNKSAFGDSTRTVILIKDK